MTWQALGACVRKEWLLLTRDLHGLALLFIMPLAFVLIMSLALQNQFAAHAGQRTGRAGHRSRRQRGLARTAGDNGSRSRRTSRVQRAHRHGHPDAGLRQALRRGDYAFCHHRGAGIRHHPCNGTGGRHNAHVSVTVAPDTGKADGGHLHRIAARRAGTAERLRAVLEAVGAHLDPQAGEDIAVRYAYGKASGGEMPSAVQQSVPGWLVFGVISSWWCRCLIPSSASDSWAHCDACAAPTSAAARCCWAS